MYSTDHEIIPIVNLHDEIIGYKTRGEITTDDIYRVAACRIKDGDGNVLLAQRSWTKKNNPGKRWPAVAGTVWKDESYLDNILKEIKEEVNIDANVDDLTQWPKQYRDWINKYFWQWFVLTYAWDKSLLQAEAWAVEQLKRYTPDELQDFLIQHSADCLQSLKWAFIHL